MTTNYCFIAPILPGGIELIRRWNKENIVNNKEHDEDEEEEVFRAAGISSREHIHLLRYLNFK
jgi:hypothetical protein